MSKKKHVPRPNKDAYTEEVSTDFSHPELERIQAGLQKFMVNQQRAVEQVIDGMALYFSGLKREKGAAAAYFFSGPSGAGKTYLAELIAWLFLDQDITWGDAPATIIKCTELSQRWEISKLLGASPGYLGYYKEDDRHGGAQGAKPLLLQEEIDKYDTKRKAHLIELVGILNQYAEQIQTEGRPEDFPKVFEELNKIFADLQRRFRSRAVVIFDEIERADQDIWELLLHIIDAGKITMGGGTETDFRNAIIVMTSNVGEERLAKYLRGGKHLGMGFLRAQEKAAEKVDQEIYDIVMEEARKVFSAPFLGRIGSGFVAFRPFQRPHLQEILDLLLWRLQARYNGSDPHYPSLTLTFDEKVKDWLIERGTDIEYGARDLRDKVDEYILKKQLVRATLAHDLATGDNILFVLENGSPVMKRIPRTGRPKKKQRSRPDANADDFLIREKTVLEQKLRALLDRFRSQPANGASQPPKKDEPQPPEDKDPLEPKPQE